MKKIIYGILILLVLVIAGVAAGIYYYGNAAVKSAIENQGSKTIGNQITLDSVKLSLIGGNMSLDGLALHNPPGYSSPNALKLDDISVSVDRDSLFSDQIIVHQITLKAPEVTVEKGPGGTNMSVIKKSMDKAMAAQGSTDESQSNVKVRIEDFYVKDARVNYLSGSGATPRTINIPDTHIRNIGASSQDGVTVENATKQIVSQLTPVVVRELVKLEGKKFLKDKLEEQLGDSPSGVKKGIGDLLNKLK